REPQLAARGDSQRDDPADGDLERSGLERRRGGHRHADRDRGRAPARSCARAVRARGVVRRESRIRDADGGQLQSARLQRRQLSLQGLLTRRRPAYHHHVARIQLYSAAVLPAPVKRKTPELSLAQARRIALAAQQFNGAPRVLRGAKAFGDLVRALGVVQIDSVNVLVRSHYLPAFSRRGRYDRALLERAAYDGRNRRLFEYWGHEASLLPIEWQPLFRWRMEAARRGEGVWTRLRRFATEHADAVASVRAQLRERGPLGAGDLVDGGRGKGSWWGWSHGKEILEWLFWTGEVTT